MILWHWPHVLFTASAIKAPENKADKDVDLMVDFIKKL